MRKDIVGYEGLYQVSDDGKVYSLKRGQEVAQRVDRCGYWRCNLSKEGKVKTWFIHRLVADAFIPNPEGKDTVNHKDENKNNNCVENLEWMTRRENYFYGTRGERSAKSHQKEVLCVETGEVFESVMAAAAAIGVAPNQVSAACRRKGSCHGNHYLYVKELENEVENNPCN